MESLILDRGSSVWIAGQARLVRSGDDIAEAADFEGWDVEKSNPMLKWIAGDFVEADNPNSNKQFWEKDELALSEYTIKYCPLNMVHKTKQPVGFFLATRSVDLTAADESSAWQLPTDDEVLEFKRSSDWAKTPSGANAPYKIIPDGGKFKVVNNTGDTKATFDSRKKALAYLRALYANVPGASKRANKVAWTGNVKDRAATDAAGTMKIQALSGMWTHVFPFEAALVDQADEGGNLFYSMECRGTHLHCAGDDGCGEVFDYQAVDDHCEHIKERSSIRHIVNPTFRGGALIIPPVRPGWSEAKAVVFQDAILQEAAFLAEQHERAYDAASAENPDLTPYAWEHLMGSIVSLAGVE